MEPWEPETWEGEPDELRFESQPCPYCTGDIRCSDEAGVAHNGELAASFLNIVAVGMTDHQRRQLVWLLAQQIAS